MRGHPDDDALTQHHDKGTGAADAADLVGAHLTDCQRCRTRLHELVTLRTRLAALRDADLPSTLLDRLTQVDHADLNEPAPDATVRVVRPPARRRMQRVRRSPRRSTRPRRDLVTTVVAHLSLLPPALTGGLAIAVLLSGAVAARQLVHAHENATAPGIAVSSIATVSDVRRSTPQSTPAVFSTPALTATDRNYRHTTLAAGVTSLVPQVLTPTSEPLLGALNAIPDAPAQDCLTALAQRNGAVGVLAVDVASYDDVPVFLVVVRGRPLRTGTEVFSAPLDAKSSAADVNATQGTGSAATVKSDRAAGLSTAAAHPARASASPSPSVVAATTDDLTGSANSEDDASPIAVTGFVVARSCTGGNVHLLDEVVVSG